MIALFLVIAYNKEVILATISIIITIILSFNEINCKTKKKRRTTRWISIGSFAISVLIVLIGIQVDGRYTRTPNLIGLTYSSAMNVLNEKELAAIPIVTGIDTNISEAIGNCIIWQLQIPDSIVEKGERIICIADNSITHSRSMMPFFRYSVEPEIIVRARYFGFSPVQSVIRENYPDQSELKMDIELYSHSPEEESEVDYWDRGLWDTFDGSEIPWGKLIDENGNHLENDQAYDLYSVGCSPDLFTPIIKQINRYIYYRNTGKRVSIYDNNLVISDDRIDFFNDKDCLFIFKLASSENDNNTIIYQSTADDYLNNNTLYIFPEFLDEGAYLFYIYCINTEDGSIYDLKINIDIS